MPPAVVFRDYFSEAIEPPGNLTALRAAISAETGAVMLESTAPGPFSRYSVYAARPLKQFRVSTGQDAFSEIDRRMLRIQDGGEPCPFAGGWFGFLAYEAGQSVEPAAGWRKREMDVPFAQWGLYESVLLHDQDCNEWRIAGLGMGESGGGAARCIAWWRDLLNRASDMSRVRERDASASLPSNVGGDECPTEYLDQVRRVLEYIKAGDVYQVNIARRRRTEWHRRPVT